MLLPRSRSIASGASPLAARLLVALGVICSLCAGGSTPSTAQQSTTYKQAAHIDGTKTPDRRVATRSGVYILSEDTMTANQSVQTIAAALGSTADIKRGNVRFSGAMQPGIRVYANGLDAKAVVAQLAATNMPIEVSDHPVGVPYSVLVSTKDRIIVVVVPKS